MAAGGRGAQVELRGVGKRYGDVTAVQDLSLVVPPGEICVLVGPSGCGKTTTLKMVNRLIEPTSGQVLIDGENVALVEPSRLRRRIGYVIQQIGLFPHLTVAENVATVPRLLDWPSERVERRVDELLALVGLEPQRVRQRYPSQLSGGERQRVGVARALAAEPPVLLMDEPFGAVDPIERERLQDEFLRLHRQLGTTVLFVTHDVDEAIKMGDGIAVLRKGGVLAQYAPPDELLAHPADEFVARFVGADRSLKRLGLVHVGEVPVGEVPTGRAGAQAPVRAEAGALVLLLDDDDRPLGWSRPVEPKNGVLAVDPARRPWPVLEVGATLRDALSVLLDSDAQAGVVTDAEGRYQGTLTVEQIAAALQRHAAEHSASARSRREHE